VCFLARVAPSGESLGAVLRPGAVDWSGGVFASCIMRVQLYVNACNWMAAVCAAAPLALANQLPLPRL